MKRILTVLAGATVAMFVSASVATAQTAVATATHNQVSSGSTYVCPKCGKLHVRASNQATSNQATSGEIQVLSNEVPIASTSRLRAGGGVTNVLAALNAQRKRSGVPVLRFDSQLQVVAQRRAQAMASRGTKGHPPGSFSPGRYEGVGWSSSYSPSGVSACFTSDSRMRYAGAAMATGRDGVYFAVVYR